MGWLEGGVDPSEVEDVAQHSFETCAITLILADSLDEKIDVERALRMAIVHDWAEALTGDFSRDISESIGSEMKENIEESVMEEILSSEIPNREAYLDSWQEYSNRESKEAKLVRIADLLSVLAEASELSRIGKQSKKLEEIESTTREELSTFFEDFPFLEDLVEELEVDF